MADSVFYDIADTPDEAANLTARGLLMVAIEQRIKEEGWTQAEAAARLHVTQPRISDLMIRCSTARTSADCRRESSTEIRQSARRTDVMGAHAEMPSSTGPQRALSQ